MSCSVHGCTIIFKAICRFNVRKKIKKSCTIIFKAICRFNVRKEKKKKKKLNVMLRTWLNSHVSNHSSCGMFDGLYILDKLVNFTD